MSTTDAVVLAVAPDRDLPVSSVRWAAREARERGVPLEIVAAYLGRDAMQSSLSAPGYHLARRRAADQAIRAVLGMPELKGVDTMATSVDGDPAGVLLHVSRSAGELVIGSRGLGPIAGALHGSIELSLAADAQCPVVVFRGAAGEPAEGAGVVAGVDAGPNSQTVLQFAFDVASRHQVPLTVVLCWHPDLLASMKWRPDQPAPRRAVRWLAEIVAGWQERFPDVVVHRAAVRDHVATALTAHAAAPYLVVVGRSGYHLPPRIAGPAYRAVLYRATCPVAVVPVPFGARTHLSHSHRDEPTFTADWPDLLSPTKGQ